MLLDWEIRNGRLDVMTEYPEDLEEAKDVWDLYEDLLCNSPFGLFTADTLFIESMTDAGRHWLMFESPYLPFIGAEAIEAEMKRLKGGGSFDPAHYHKQHPLLLNPDFFYLADLDMTDGGVLRGVHQLYATAFPWALLFGQSNWFAYPIPEPWKVKEVN